MISAAVIEALKEIVPADKVLLQEPMKLHTTFRIGGLADCLVRNTFGWWMFPIP